MSGEWLQEISRHRELFYLLAWRDTKLLSCRGRPHKNICASNR